MSAATVRHHVAILQADGRITCDATAKRTRGRPEKLYRLSDAMRGDNLALLSDVLLGRWLDGLTADHRQNALASIAEKMNERMGTVDDQLPATKRLVELNQKLNEHHYQARWEAGAEGPKVFFGQCPYAEIIDQHPELCKVDSLYLSGVLHAEVEQRSKIDRKTGQPSQCAFAVKRTVKRRD